MLTFLRVAAARIRGFLRRDDLERDFELELQSHLAMAEEEKIRQGLSPAEARRVARVELGGLTQLREAGREARGLPWLDTTWLDIKLGLRMLRKSWGLTLVGGLAMTLAIGIGVVVAALLDLAFGGTLPLPDGDRVVALQVWDARAHRRQETSRPDFERWRDGLRSVEDVGAFHNVERNLTLSTTPLEEGRDGWQGPAEPVTVAEMTASGFRLARVPSHLGRPLVEDDERDGAPPVVVLGYEVWRSRLSADPAVLGRTIRLDDTLHTVVGVMPEGFAFPVNHRFWTPLRAGRSEALRTGGPSGAVFARLAEGVTLERAQAELATLGLLPSATVSPVDDERYPRIVPYPFAFTGDFEPGEVRWAIRIVLLLVTLLLIPPTANLAILVYARTVTRQEEFAARYVLGASRGRIIGQLFIEMLVLSALSAGLALGFVRLALRHLEISTGRHLTDGAPFWMDFNLSPATVGYAAALAGLAALIAGVMPALKATGKEMSSPLRSLSARSGPQLGATWTALVVIQIALSLAALPSAVEVGWGTVRQGILGPGFAAQEFLTAQLGLEPAVARPGGLPEGSQRTFESRFSSLQTEVIQQLEAEPGVSAMTVAAAVPGDEPWLKIEVDSTLQLEESPAARRLVRLNRVDDRFFEVFDIPLLAGRGFHAGDVESRAAVIVNRTFAQQLFGEQSPLGQRVRWIRPGNREADGRPEASTAEPPTWVEIVGVVADCPANPTNGTMYLPMAPGQVHPATLTVRLDLPPATIADRLRDITTALDPSLRIEEVVPLDEIYRGKAVGNNLGASTLAAVTLSVLLLSAAGIYALMSFTVNQRRREIGIRAALGAPPRYLVASIFRRALGQLALGAAGGVLVALAIDYFLPIETVGGWNVPGVIPAAAALMISIGLLATVGPARRGFRVEPTEALRNG